MIVDIPCEIKNCNAPLELSDKKLDLITQQWIGVFVCLNKHTYKKPINTTTDYDSEIWNVDPEAPIWEDPNWEEGIQEELPFFDES